MNSGSVLNSWELVVYSKLLPKSSTYVMSLIFKECVEHSENDEYLKACYSLMLDYVFVLYGFGGGGGGEEVVHSLVTYDDIGG